LSDWPITATPQILRASSMPRNGVETMGFLKEKWWDGSEKMSNWQRLAVWRSERKESSTVEGRKRKEGQKRGRKGKKVV
jgi:hypothetical protein